MSTSGSDSTFEIGDRVIVQDISSSSSDNDVAAAATTLTDDHCNMCGVEASLTCAGCRTVKYCSKEHQKADWKSHKKRCKETKARQTYYANMHGTVVKVDEFKCEAAVDLDLTMDRLQLPLTALKREPPIKEGQHRADVENGCLVEAEGRPIDTVLSCTKVVAANVFMTGQNVGHIGHIHDLMETQEGFLKLAHITSTAWSFWSDGRGFVSDGKGTYDHMKQYVCVDLPENNPDCLDDPVIVRAIKAVDDVAAAKSWNVRVHGQFWIVGMDNDGTLLIPDNNRSMVFKCVGIRNPIWPMVLQNHAGRFPLMTVTMIPWYGRLVYDGVLLPPDGFPIPPVASPHLERRLKASLQQAKDQGRVIERLAQLEVEGGSLVGLHDLIAASKSKEKKEQEPPTSAEQTLVDKIKKIPKMPEPDFNQTENIEGMWVMRRMGYTEIENPEHQVVILNSGAPLGFFSCANLVPNSQEILKALLKTAKQQGKRPILVGVDDSETADRVEFLLKDVEGTRGYYYPPPTAEETAALSLRMG